MNFPIASSAVLGIIGFVGVDSFNNNAIVMYNLETTASNAEFHITSGYLVNKMYYVAFCKA